MPFRQDLISVFATFTVALGAVLSPAGAATILRVDATSQPAEPATGYLRMGSSVSSTGIKLDINFRRS